MTPQERQLIDDLFDRLAKLENAPRDPNAVAAIAQGLRTAPNAAYGLVQTVLVQDEALRRADSRIQELEAAAAPEPNQSGGFLDSMRETIFGQGSSHGSVPNVPPPQAGRPVWNSGQLLQQAPPQEHYNEPPYGQSYGAPPSAFGGGGGGGGGSFLGTAAASAAGAIGGSLLLNSFRSMMGGSRQSFADASATGNRSQIHRAINPAATSRAMPASMMSARRRVVPMTLRAPGCSTRPRTTIARTTTTTRTTWIRIRMISAAMTTATTPDRSALLRKNGRSCERPFVVQARRDVRSRRPWRRH